MEPGIIGQIRYVCVCLYIYILFIKVSLMWAKGLVL